jgi:hypothetical protein
MAILRRAPNCLQVARIAARVWVSVVALAAIGWGMTMLPYFWRGAALNWITAQIVQGQTFPSSVLTQQAALADSAETSFCDPARTHDAVVLHLAILEQAAATPDDSQVRSARDQVDHAVRKALACSPADAFVWLTLFWLEVSKHGYQPRDGDYLRLSYALAPYEGWMALWRCKLALAVLDKLPADLASKALEEFARLVETERLFAESMAIFSSVPRVTQIRLTEQLKSATPTARQTFARMLYDQGSDLTIPGVEATPNRPWH